MAIDWNALSPEDILATAKQLEKDVATATSGIESLETKKTELLAERARQKRTMRALTERGLDTKSKDFDEKLAELLAEVDEYKEKGTAAPPTTPPADPAGDGIPGDLNPEVKAMLARMTSQINDLTSKNEQAALREETLQKEMEQSRLKSTVIEKLKDAGVARPEHLFSLTEQKYKLADDKKTVFGGDEYDPVPLGTIVENLKNSDEFGDYFKGSGNTGSGFQSASTSVTNPQFTRNPYVKGGNATEASALYNANPEKAKMLLIQAKQAGTIDPTMEKVFLQKG
jgi:hypothetical protein